MAALAGSLGGFAPPGAWQKYSKTPATPVGEKVEDCEAVAPFELSAMLTPAALSTTSSPMLSTSLLSALVTLMYRTPAVAFMLKLAEAVAAAVTRRTGVPLALARKSVAESE